MAAALASATGVGAIGAIACGSSSTMTTPAPTIADSSFAAAVTGTVTDSLTGPALFQEIQEANGTDTGFAVSLGIGSQTGALVFFRADSGIPDRGTYTLYPDTATAAPGPTQFYVVGALGPTCSGCSPTGVLLETSGTLTFTATASTRVHGVFAVTGFEIPLSDTSARDSIGITGEFAAAAGVPVIDTTTTGVGPCSFVACGPALPYPIVERTASGDFVSNAWKGRAGSVTGRAVNTRSQRAER